MNLQVKILDIDTVNELETYWNNADFINLLKEVDFPDAEKSKPEEIKELLYMALTDFEPDEAAKIVLTYKLGERLSEGQIHSLCHEMIEDKVAEEYPDPAFHYDLFNINQLLFKAFNGTFQNTEASIIDLEITSHDKKKEEITKEVLTKALAMGLTDRSVISRLYSDQIEGEAPFDDAVKIIWQFTHSGDKYKIITSRYWIEKEDIAMEEYEAHIKFFKESE